MVKITSITLANCLYLDPNPLVHILGGHSDLYFTISDHPGARQVHRLEPFTLYFCLASCSHIDTLYTRLFIIHCS
ncbi:hypothetical protein M6B38_332490 [Iris pallida]|uniref:Uncharacterized protein n=1 Tax=Iris pallida TaxID=29817 RepID=A0AAX6H3N1_IRIPA|nr:hypothetical protein M6B38_332490 [Iris pallida]